MHATGASVTLIDVVPDLLLPVLAAMGLLLLLAGFLIRQGLYGWPKNAVLLCRRCEYLLQGLERPKVCPECGADLTRRRAIRVGENRRRKRVLTAGMLVLMLFVSLSWMTYSSLRRTGIDWYRIKPLWMLRLEARNNNAAVAPGVSVRASAPALFEIVRRMNNGTLSSGQKRAAALDALAIQGDPNVAWTSAWADVIDAAMRHKLLTEEETAQYFRQSFLGSPQLRVAARVREDSPLKMAVVVWPFRGAQGITSVGTRYVGGIHEMTMRDESGRAMLESPPLIIEPNTANQTLEIDHRLPVGQYSGTIESRIVLRWFDRQPDGTHVLRNAPPLATWVHTQPASFEVIAAGQLIVVPKADEKLRSAIIASITIDFQATNGYMLLISNPPANLSFDVLVRASGAGNVEREIGSIVASSGVLTMGQPKLHPRWLFPETKTVDVILRANPSLAEARLTIGEVWDGEIVIPDVPVGGLTTIPQSQPDS